jgi:antitoxin Phd
MTVEMPVTRAREHFSSLIKTARHEPVFLTRRGHPEAVVISADEYERLMEADEDARDLVAADTAMAEVIAGAPTIPWEHVKADLGLA